MKPVGPANTVGLNLFSPVSKGLLTSFALTPPVLQWRPSSPLGIRRWNEPEVWHAGHVDAIVPLGAAVVVGAQTGGAWLVNPDLGAVPAETFPARSLSWDWANPDVATLAPGPDGPTTIFAGGGRLDGANSALHVIRLAESLGAITFTAAAEIPLPWALSVNEIVVVPASRRIVLATQYGVYWSAVPADPLTIGAYNWQPAVDGPPAASGIALGPGGTVVAAAQGDGVAGSERSGFWVGSWSAGSLSMVKSSIAGTAPAMTRTSIAASRNHPEVLYAVAAAADGKQLGAVLRSGDGGASFAPCQPPSGTGDQGSYNNCIAVHPNDPATVAIGWRTGPFISHDQGTTWARSTDEPAADGHMHADVHTLVYAEADGGVDLWAGTDGGVCRSRDGGATWDSRYNKHLRTIQYYGATDMYNKTVGTWSSMSTFDASPWEPGLHGGANQDNGNVWARAGLEHVGSQVRQFEPGDGNTVLFVSATAVLHRNNTLSTAAGVEYGNRIRRSDYDPATHELDDPEGVVVPADGLPDGLPMPSAAARVADPHYQRDGARMLAVFAAGTAVYGYFDTAAPGRLRPLADVGPGAGNPPALRLVTAVASHTGGTVLAGTSDGHIYAIDAATGRITEQPTSLDGRAGSPVTRLLWPTAAKRFATIGNWAVARWDPRLSTTANGRPGVWLLTPGVLTSGATGLAYSALATGGAALFACTDFGVEVSLDDGDTWSDCGARLPARPHCRDLAVGLNAAGRPALYVATYGWGAFLADLPERRDDGGLGHIPAEMAEILIGIIAGGGGVEIVNGHVRIVPPRGPARELAAALVVRALSQQLSGRAAELTARLAEELGALAGEEEVTR